jgi:hypothetical protein
MALVFADRSRRYWLALGGAAGVAGVVVLPVYRAFVLAREASGATLGPHGADEVNGYSSHVSDYLASSAAAHEWWLPALGRWNPWVEVLFPGIAVLALAGVCVAGYASANPARRRQMVAYGLLAVMAAWASFGPKLALYSMLDAAVPGMSLIRAPARFGIVVTFALSVLAGMGVARLTSGRRWLAGVLVVLVACELGVKTADWGWPSWPLRVADPPSPAYRALASLPRGVFVEFQFPYERSNYHNHAQAMFWSTFHWQPMVNGYSDVIPPDFDAIALPINGFPDPASFAIMRARQVRYVLWHVDYYQGTSREVLLDRLARYQRNLRPIMLTPDTWLYEIVQWPE